MSPQAEQPLLRLEGCVRQFIKLLQHPLAGGRDYPSVVEVKTQVFNLTLRSDVR